jgi:hypothetical protein
VDTHTPSHADFTHPTLFQKGLHVPYERLKTGQPLGELCVERAVPLVIGRRRLRDARVEVRPVWDSTDRDLYSGYELLRGKVGILGLWSRSGNKGENAYSDDHPDCHGMMIAQRLVVRALEASV